MTTATFVTIMAAMVMVALSLVLGTLLAKVRATMLTIAMVAAGYGCAMILAMEMGSYHPPLDTYPRCPTEDAGRPDEPCVWVGQRPDENGYHVKIYYSREPW